jgi:hypothetical protein
MIDRQPWSLQRRALLAGFAALAANTAIGGGQGMAAIEQNTLKRRGIGLRAFEPERAFAGFTLFAPHFVQNRNVYLVDLQGEVVHTWNIPYPPGLSGYLTERGTLFYNGRTSEESFLSRFPFKGGVVLEADWNGKVLWEVRHPDHHHHGILLRNGNVLLHCMAEVLVGQKKAIAIAVRNVSGRRRWSKLAEWLRPGPPVSRQFGIAN